MKSKRKREIIHSLAILVAAGLQDTVEHGRFEVPEDLLQMIENKLSLLSSTEAENAARDIFKVLVVIHRYLPEFDTQPVKDTVFRAARRIAVRDGRLGGKDPGANRSYNQICSREEVRATRSLPPPPVNPNRPITPRIEEQLETVDDERCARLAALADSLLACCAPPQKRAPRSRPDSTVA